MKYGIIIKKEKTVRIMAGSKPKDLCRISL
jgi:hypothetical protein